MEILNTENYQGIDILFCEEFGMGPCFDNFECEIRLLCFNNKYEIVINSKENNFFKNIPLNENRMVVDYKFFDNIIKRLKNINYNVFLNDLMIADAECMEFQISTINYTIKIFYYPFIIYDKECEKNYGCDIIKYIKELNSIYEILKKEINYDDWYLSTLNIINKK
jgi:hypothetical protein